MNGADLVYLAGATDLSHLEFASPRLTLRTESDKLYAEYAGAYSSGCRWIEQDKSIPELDIDVDSVQFGHFASTFRADTPVRISRTATALNLRSKGSNHTLRCFPATERLRIPDDVVPFATVAADKLAAEVDLAANLNAQNKQTSGPIGLNLTVNKAKRYLRVLSYNGHSALFLAQIDCEDVTEDTSVVVPAKDFAQGLELFSGGLLQLGMSMGRLTLRSNRAWFTSPTENTVWPNFTQMLKKHPTVDVTFRADVLKSAAVSAKVLGAASVLEVCGGSHGVILRTAATEAGSFAVATEGQLEGNFFYGVEDLLFASRMCKEEVTLQIGSKAPTTIKEGKRMLVVMTRVV